MITFKAKTQSGEIINSALSPFTFPAGEAHTKRETQRELEPIEIAIVQSDATSIHDDLFQLAMWNNLLINENRQIKRVVVIPYFPGARADRGTPFGADVYVRFLQNLMLNQIITYDPHSEVYVELLREDPVLKVTPVYPHEILARPEVAVNMPNVYYGVIAPDEGAKTRAGAVAEALGVPLFTAGKTRDFETGKLSGFHMEQAIPWGQRYLVVDDICDGGGTFVGLSEHLRENVEDVLLDLYISHGVFSGEALTKLSNAFGRIITTDSYNPLRTLAPKGSTIYTPFRRLDVIRPLLERIDV